MILPWTLTSDLEKDNKKEIKMCAQSNLSEVKFCPSGDICDFVTRHKISDYPDLVFFNSPSESNRRYPEIIWEIGYKIVLRVFGIPGVKTIFIYPHTLCVRKEDSFSWKDLVPQITKAILESEN